MSLTEEDRIFALNFADTLRRGDYCPDPSPYHADLLERLTEAAFTAAQLQIELDAMTDCAEERRNRAKAAELAAEKYKHSLQKISDECETLTEALEEASDALSK